jgi:hypothetical protein
VLPSLIAWYTPAKGPKWARSPTSASLTARSRKAKAKAAAKAVATKVDPEVNVGRRRRAPPEGSFLQTYIPSIRRGRAGRFTRPKRIKAQCSAEWQLTA